MDLLAVGFGWLGSYDGIFAGIAAILGILGALATVAVQLKMIPESRLGRGLAFGGIASLALAIVIVVILVVPRPDQQSQITQERWDHNGSIMTWSQEGANVRITYDAPRNSLSRMGIVSGMLLFYGTRSEDVVSGKARVFSSRCAPAEYDVSGSFTPSGALVLQGPSPIRLFGNCNISYFDPESQNAELRFEPLN